MMDVEQSESRGRFNVYRVDESVAMAVGSMMDDVLKFILDVFTATINLSPIHRI